jgi:superfamily II DNA or RNA helicase
VKRQLRSWQFECIESAVSKFKKTSHFLCQATPGAGKTFMVAKLAETLLKQEKIDLVFCFSPSRTVARAMAATFSEVLGKRFDGRIGAAGASHTYQSMNTLPQQHWRLLEEYRVLVVLDEIHHCSGFTEGDVTIGNSWGRDILSKIQDKALYTIALSGTPWRTDDAPIVLSHYIEGGTRIQHDYQYGLRAAINDSVCRIPKVVLTDNREINFWSPDIGSKKFTSLQDSLSGCAITYQDFLYKNEVVDHIVVEASAKLKEIRTITPDAGGLVVAASVKHAFQIADRFALIGETYTVVTHQTPEAQDVIADFAQSSAQWIISVGMISEGTDIPRLQVCCHFSQIRTELHFRQVLGRILRTRENEPQRATGWLYVLAEPSLELFARRIGEELPGENIVSYSPKNHALGKKRSDSATNEQLTLLDLDWDTNQFFSSKESNDAVARPPLTNSELRISDQYWQEVVSLFNTPT